MQDQRSQRRRGRGRRAPGLVAALLPACLLLLGGGGAGGDELSEEALAAIEAAEQARVSAIDRVYGAVVAIYGEAFSSDPT